MKKELFVAILALNFFTAGTIFSKEVYSPVNVEELPKQEAPVYSNKIPGVEFTSKILYGSLFVCKKEGLTLYAKDAQSSKKLGTAPFRIALKELATKDEWVKVLVPRYLWKTSGQKAAWVQKEGLSHLQPVFSCTDWTKEDLDFYLRSAYWRGSITRSEMHFYIHKTGDHAADAGFFKDRPNLYGVWKTLSANEVYVTWRLPEKNYAPFNEKLKILAKSSAQFSIPGATEDYILSFENYTDPKYFEENLDLPALYDCTNLTFLQALEKSNLDEKTKARLVKAAIEAGVSPQGTKYEQQYKNYWAKAGLSIK